MINKIIHKLTFPRLKRLGEKEKKKAVREFGNRELLFPPIFIIGAPRCGSTVFYQAMTNAMDVVYFTNYAIKRYPSIVHGMKKSFAKYQGSQHPYQSRFGDTAKPHEPSEGSYFWYQWFPYNKHYLTQSDIDESSKKEIYSLVNAIMHQHQKVMVFKNLNCGQRIDVLQDIFKNPLYIHIERSPAEVIRSMHRAKKSRNLSDADWFSVKSKNYETLKTKTGLDQLCAQYQDLHQQIKHDLGNIAKKNVLSVSYASFCKDPQNTLNEVYAFIKNHIPGLVWNEKFSCEEITKNKYLLDNQQEKELQNYLQKYGLNE